jgi:hypothetical protein
MPWLGLFSCFSQYCEKRLLASSYLSVRLLLRAGFFIRFDILGFFETLSRKSKFDCNLRRITDTLHEELCTFVISGWIILRMRSVSDRSPRENQKGQPCSIIFFFESCAVYEIMWKNVVVPDRPQMTIQYGADKTRFACQITKVRIHARTHVIEYLRFSKATVVTRTRFNVNVVRTLPVLL